MPCGENAIWLWCGWGKQGVIGEALYSGGTMSKKATAKSSIAQSKKKSASTQHKRMKSVSFKSSPWYAMAARTIGVASAPR